MYLESMIVDSLYFESLDSYEHNKAWENFVRSKIEGNAEIKRWSYWVQIKPGGADISDQGFKLHISPDFEKIDAQFRIAVLFLLKEGVSFKFVADKKLLLFTNGKNFLRSASGKFITVYPENLQQFLTLSELLSTVLSEFKGPYILTDRLVPNSKCVFYRFGGHKRISVPNGEGGSFLLVRAHDGTYVEDVREPRFYLPPDVADPFNEVATPTDKNLSLNKGRYQILGALHFSNSGGIYKALDTSTGVTVALKEARKYAGMRDTVSAQEALRHEYQVLLDLNDIGGTPYAYDLFEEWESIFLVEEYLPMTSWHNVFTFEKYFLGPFYPGSTRVDDHLEMVTALSVEAIEILQKIHDRGYVLGDVSINNILVDVEKKKLRFIDVESAVKLGDQLTWQGWWNTPGFARPERGRETPLIMNDDWYALGKCLISAAMNFGDISRLGGMTTANMVGLIEDYASLPLFYGQAILYLLDGNYVDANRNLKILTDMYKAGGRKNIYSCDSRVKRICRKDQGPVGVDDLDYSQICAGVVDFFENAYRGLEATEVWPADPMVYSSSKFNLAYGASGIASVMKQLNRKVVPELEDHLISHKPNHDSDIGLFTGLSGLAYYRAARGHKIESEQLLDCIASSPIRYKTTGIMTGEAGIGMAALSIYRMNASGYAMSLAIDCVRYLKDKSIRDDSGNAYWLLNGFSKDVHYGYMTGVAGISFSLFQMGLATGDECCTELATSGIDFVISRAFTDSYGNLQWGKHSRDRRSLPYFASGAAGIGSILLRMGLVLDRKDYIDLSKRLASSSFTKLSVCVGQFDGLAGIAEFFTDLKVCNQGSMYGSMAEEVAEGIKKYGIRRDQGIIFPGWLSVRASCDFATGAAGVASALARVNSGGRREFFDFNLPTAELFVSAPNANVGADWALTNTCTHFA